MKSSKKENREKNKSNANHLPIFFGFKALGRIIGSYFGGRFILFYSNETIFLITAQLCIIPLIVTIFYKEQIVQTTHKKRSIKEEIILLKDLVFRDKILELIVLMLLINLTPSFD